MGRIVDYNLTEEIEHGVYVSCLARDLAKELGYSEAFQRDIANAGLVHDIGKLQLANYIYGEERMRSLPEDKEIMVPHSSESQKGSGESQKGSGESQKGSGESQKGSGESQKGSGESQKGSGESQKDCRETNKVTSGPLVVEEIKYVRMHPKLSYDILKARGYNDRICMSVLRHHENWDGSGYPDNIAGTSIPPGGRIIRVCDVFAALTTDRPYRRRFEMNEAIGLMIDEINHFDMGVFLAFERVVHSVGTKYQVTFPDSDSELLRSD
ncbi:MAG TPA: HD domain-containing protein [Lachnospiraceae bacterium]|nr:HD domain-containing protein [Lachnospiraceae bacterium]